MIDFGYVHITVNYICGHDMLRPVRRDDKKTLAWVVDGWMRDDNRCKHCNMQVLRILERRMERLSGGAA